MSRFCCCCCNLYRHYFVFFFCYCNKTLLFGVCVKYTIYHFGELACVLLFTFCNIGKGFSLLLAWTHLMYFVFVSLWAKKSLLWHLVDVVVLAFVWIIDCRSYRWLIMMILTQRHTHTHLWHVPWRWWAWRRFINFIAAAIAIEIWPWRPNANGRIVRCRCQHWRIDWIPRDTIHGASMTG